MEFFIPTKNSNAPRRATFCNREGIHITFLFLIGKLHMHPMSLTVCLVGVKSERMENGRWKRGVKMWFFIVWLESKGRGKKIGLIEFSTQAYHFFFFNLGEKKREKMVLRRKIQIYLHFFILLHLKILCNNNLLFYPSIFHPLYQTHIMKNTHFLPSQFSIISTFNPKTLSSIPLLKRKCHLS